MKRIILKRVSSKILLGPITCFEINEKMKETRVG
jgi:hypothetical protein